MTRSSDSKDALPHVVVVGRGHWVVPTWVGLLGMVLEEERLKVDLGNLLAIEGDCEVVSQNYPTGCEVVVGSVHGYPLLEGRKGCTFCLQGSGLEVVPQMATADCRRGKKLLLDAEWLGSG